MPAIQPITDDLLVAAIDGANRRVVLIAPGVWPPVAEALAKAWQRLGSSGVTAILDVDPEICRIGYGSLEGLATLQKAATAAGESIGQESGVRICVLIADEQTFVFSPTPRQLETPPGDPSPVGVSQVKSNGIVLSTTPAALANELGAGAEGDGTRTFGMEPLDDAKLKRVTRDLQENPVKAFDLTRAVNVYNAKIQFVELKVSGCRLSEHTARLPKHLLHVLKKNPALSQKIQNSIRLLDETDELINDPKLSQDTIFKKRDTIDEKYLRPITGVGKVMVRSKRTDFLTDVKALEVEVARFAKGVESKLDGRFRDMAHQVAAEVLGDVLAEVPPNWRRQLGARPDPEQARWLIVDDLLRAFGDPAKKVGRMTVEVVFKDVTYDMLKEPAFREEVAQHYPDLALMDEFAAAKERTVSGQATLFN